MESQLVKQKAMNLKESGKGCIGVFGGKREKGKMLQLNYNLKKVAKLFLFYTCSPPGLTVMLHCPKMRYPCILFSFSLAKLFFMRVYWD